MRKAERFLITLAAIPWSCFGLFAAIHNIGIISYVSDLLRLAHRTLGLGMAAIFWLPIQALIPHSTQLFVFRSLWLMRTVFTSEHTIFAGEQSEIGWRSIVTIAIALLTWQVVKQKAEIKEIKKKGESLWI